MNIKHLRFRKPVKLKSGTKVTSALVGESPIVLVKGISKEGSDFQSRLDLQKIMFVDPMPDAKDSKDASSVTRSVQVLLRLETEQAVFT